MKNTIRQATPDDKDFIITSIIEAEKSGSDAVSYCGIFSISEDQLRSLLSDILDEGIEGQELCLSNFLIAEVNGGRAATLSTWIENEEGIPSNVIKSNIFMYTMGRDKLLGALETIALMNQVNINRTENTLQVECVFTHEEFRGNGLTRQLIDESISTKKKNGASFEKVQVILLKNNASAIKAYEKAGFFIVEEKRCADSRILDLLPCDTKILMEKNLNAA
jgi:ribosomal protein S18 acetylase RimI-like enzyme